MVCFVIMTFIGGAYIFDMYSSVIKIDLNYDQQIIYMLGLFKDLGSNVGMISSMVYTFIPQWVVLAMGGVMNIIGFMMVWLTITCSISTHKNGLCFCT